MQPKFPQPPLMLTLLTVLSFCFLLVQAGSHGSFVAKVGHKAIAHDKLFHNKLLGQLQSYRNSFSPSTSATTSTVVDLASPTPGLDFVLAANADNDTSPFAANSTTSFQLYTSDSLPSPTPPAACATALIATIQCNSTIPLMR